MRLRWALLGAVMTAGLLAGWVEGGMPPADPFPYADRVPADAAVYLAIPDLPRFLDRLDRHPEWATLLPDPKVVDRLRKARPYLSGPGAFFARREGSRLVWTAYLHTIEGGTHIEGEPYAGPDTIRSTLAAWGHLDPLPRLVLNLDRLPGKELWREFSHAILEIRMEEALTLKGSLTYRRGAFPEIVRRRIHAPSVPEPGKEGIFSHSGLCDVRELLGALRIHPPLPDQVYQSLGPAWGVEVRGRNDIAFWFEAGEEARILDGHRWNGFTSEVREGKWIVRTQAPAVAGPRRFDHAVTRIDSRALAPLLRDRWGESAGPLFALLRQTREVESRLRYRSDAAHLMIRVTR